MENLKSQDCVTHTAFCADWIPFYLPASWSTRGRPRMLLMSSVFLLMGEGLRAPQMAWMISVTHYNEETKREGEERRKVSENVTFNKQHFCFFDSMQIYTIKMNMKLATVKFQQTYSTNKHDMLHIISDDFALSLNFGYLIFCFWYQICRIFYIYLNF